MKKIISPFIAVLASSIFICGCTPSEESGISSKACNYFSMNTDASLVISDVFTAERKSAFDGLCEDVGKTLNGIERSISLNVENSSIARFNAAGAGETVEIDIIAYEVLTLAKSVYALTDGYYNPAIYYNVAAYGFNGSSLSDKPTSERIPSDGIIEKYNELSSRFGETEIYDKDGKYYAKKPEAEIEAGGENLSMKIDLGGIGKGYAVDEVNELIEERGFNYGFFSFGTSSIVVKEHHSNGDYIIQLTNPRPDYDGGTYLNIKVKGEGLSTSGDYEQYFLYDSDGDGTEERYCHVFNPATGKPVQTGIMSATVIGGSAAEDDALSTAIMAMGKDRAVEFINAKMSDRRVVFCCERGGKYEVISNVPKEQFGGVHVKYEFNYTLSDGKIVSG